MDNQFWHDLWEKSDIKFDQTQINTYLLKYCSELGNLRNKNIFIPLCGKSIDMLWFLQQGSHVLGIELSPLAIEAFFNENKIDFQKFDQDDFIIYKNSSLTLICGDFFKLKKEYIGNIDITYDRAALIALPKIMRLNYGTKMAELLPSQSKLLLITIEYKTTEPEQPPYSVTDQEVHSLYHKDFNITLLHDKKIQL